MFRPKQMFTRRLCLHIQLEAIVFQEAGAQVAHPLAQHEGNGE